MGYYFEAAFFIGAGWGLAGFLRDLLVSGLNGIIMWAANKKAKKMYEQIKQRGETPAPSFVP